MTRLIDIAGNTYGKITVLRRAKNNKHGRTMWDCVCECGRNHVANGSDLRHGKTKSCGCAQYDWNTLPEGESSFRHLIYTWKRQAHLRDYAWSLTEDEVRILIAEECYYCGLPPSNFYQSHKASNGGIVYSGLDRTNNDVGYRSDNVVPCCKYCNKAKSDRTTEEFYRWTEAVFRRSVLHVGKLDFVLI